MDFGTFSTLGRCVTTTPRETHCGQLDNILLKAFSLKLPPARAVES